MKALMMFVLMIMYMVFFWVVASFVWVILAFLASLTVTLVVNGVARLFGG